MNRVFVHGLGAVSPAGWGVGALTEAVARGDAIPTQDLTRPGWDQPLKILAVPNPPTRPQFYSHPRMRRTGSMALHAVGAALEAIGASAPSPRLGIIVTMLSGLVTYSRRFYEEVLRDPPTASPLLFPETVFNAPASHLAAYLGSKSPNCTLVGDDGMFLQALGLAAHWLATDEVDACVVVGVEELDWLVPNALRLFSRRDIYSSGAGAVYLTAAERGAFAELTVVTDAFSYSQTQNRLKAARKARGQLPHIATDELLCSSARDLPQQDLAECEAWRDWTGPRLKPKAILGEGFAAAAAWQCVAACDQIRSGAFKAANVSVVGATQQAIGARFATCQ